MTGYLRSEAVYKFWRMISKSTQLTNVRFYVSDFDVDIDIDSLK